jgi:hypothetical protein
MVNYPPLYFNMSKTETYISFIIDQLKTGNVERGKVLAIFGKKWQTGTRSFDRYWKEANERHLEAQNKLQKEKDIIYIDAEKEAIKRNILQKHEALEILSKIAKGTAKKVQEQIVIPSSSEQRAAIETMAKIEGWFAPTKQEIKGSVGVDEIIIKK